MTYNRRASTR